LYISPKNVKLNKMLFEKSCTQNFGVDLAILTLSCLE